MPYPGCRPAAIAATLGGFITESPYAQVRILLTTGSLPYTSHGSSWEAGAPGLLGGSESLSPEFLHESRLLAMAVSRAGQTVLRKRFFFDPSGADWEGGSTGWEPTTAKELCAWIWAVPSHAQDHRGAASRTRSSLRTPLCR